MTAQRELERLQRLYAQGSVVGRTGKLHPLHSGIDHKEGEFLFTLIQGDPEIRKTLEVGCAYGLSSQYICAALRDRDQPSHTMIDPFQNTQWDGAGVAGLERAGITFFNLIELRSEFALPQLVESHEGTFDFVFIDGWHTFDHTLLDCFYATRLLRVGGTLVVDDVSFPAVRRVINYLKTYPCYEEYAAVRDARSLSWKRRAAQAILYPLGRRTASTLLHPDIHSKIYDDHATRMVALKKTAGDDRSWNWYSPSF